MVVVSAAVVVVVVSSTVVGVVSCNQFAIIFGMLVVYFVNYMIKDGMPDFSAIPFLLNRRYTVPLLPMFNIFCISLTGVPDS